MARRLCSHGARFGTSIGAVASRAAVLIFITCLALWAEVPLAPSPSRVRGWLGAAPGRQSARDVGANFADANRPRTDVAARQIRNYKDGKALIVNVHVTHHAGTSLCGLMKSWGPTPDFACIGGSNFENVTTPDQRSWPWTHNDTALMVATLRPHFHMVSWELYGRPKLPMAGVDWEDPRVVSVYIARDPIDRLLAGDGEVNNWFGKEDNRTEEDWWKYARHDYTNNFALNRLTTSKCVDEENTTEACLEEAKGLLRRFTFVLDQACLDEGFAALGAALGHPVDLESMRRNKKPRSQLKSAKDRIGNDELYEHLLRRNRRDIEFYNWSKNESLVVCPGTSPMAINEGGPTSGIGDREVQNSSVAVVSPLVKFSGPDADKDRVVDLDTERNFTYTNRNSTRTRQIQNYKDGKALIVNVHITHHAGTYFCRLMKSWGPTPDFACMGGSNFENVTTPEQRRWPWTHDDTAPMVASLRPHFHMVSWEFGQMLKRPLAGVDWEDPQVVSVYIARDPIDRLLAGDGEVNKWFGKEDDRAEEDWWKYARHGFTNNYALDRLTTSKCVDEENTTEAC
ncbi:hypothetical protein ACHAWF_011168, partial [Thalassiosira exigua]